MLEATIYNDVKGFSHIKSFPTSLFTLEAEAELAESKNDI
jgi:hypothetical protein